MKLEENIYRLRMSHGLSQESLAELLGVSRQSVSKWETGTSVPDLDKLIKLCDIFGVTLDELTGRTEPSESGGTDTDDSSDNADAVADANTADAGLQTPPAAYFFPPYTYTPAPVPNISRSQRIFGTILIFASIAALLGIPILLTLKADADAETTRTAAAAVVIAIPAAAGLICGFVCLIVRRHAGLVCLFIVFATVIVSISLLLATSYIGVDIGQSALPKIDAHSERITPPGE